jgi:hypothetical protein
MATDPCRHKWKTVEMLPQNSAIWMIHCNIAEHMRCRNGNYVQGRSINGVARTDDAGLMRGRL